MRPRKAPSPSARAGAVAGALDAFRRIVRDLRRSARAAEQHVGVSGAQLFVLQQLLETAPQSINELADRTHTDQSSVSVVVSRLVKRRLVTRTRARDDGRRVELDVTPAGRALLRRTPAMAQRRLLEALERIPLADARALATILGRVCAEMGIDGSDGAVAEEGERLTIPAGARASRRPSRGRRQVAARPRG